MKTLAQLQAENEVLRDALSDIVESSIQLKRQEYIVPTYQMKNAIKALAFCPAPDGTDATSPDVFQADGAGQLCPCQSKSEKCHALSDNWGCTLPIGHDGDHVACAVTQHNCHSWPQTV